MGRGKQWPQELLAEVEGDFADGLGPAAVRRSRPSLSLHTLKHLHSRWQAGERLVEEDGDGGGQGHCKVTEAQVQSIREKLRESPLTSISKMLAWAKAELALECSRSTMHRIMKETSSPLKLVKCQRISAINMEKRLPFATSLLFRIRMASRIRLPRDAPPLRPLDTKKMWVQDEKFFRLHGDFSTQNKRAWLSSDVSKKDHMKGENSKFLRRPTAQSDMAGVMVCALVNDTHGFAPIKIVKSDVKINALVFREMLEFDFIPFVMATTGEGSSILLDNAPSHCAISTKKWLGDLRTSIHVEGVYQPPNSPDLNGLDFFFWSLLQEKVGEQPTKEALTAAIVQETQRLNESWDQYKGVLTNTFKQRLEKCKVAKGGHFEG